MRRAAGSTSERGGFALTVAVFAVLIIAALANGGLYIAVQQSRAGSAGSRAAAALYAAEAGLSVALANWDAVALDSLRPGATIAVASGRLVSGEDYAVRITRLDSGQDARLAYYLALSTGRAHGAWGGRRQVALLLRARPSDDLCCGAALTTRGELRVAEGGMVRGSDRAPEAWAADSTICAGRDPSARPGVVTDDEALVRLEPDGVIDGSPPVLQSPSLEADPWADMQRRFRELAERADVVYGGDTQLGEIGPRLDAQGDCARPASGNWGAPALPDHPCFDFLPIIHVAGDLLIESSGSGQGTLLVDGNLTLRGGFEFYGVLIVKGRVTLTDQGSQVHGAVWVHNVDPESSLVGAGAGIGYSSCAIRRAVRGSKLQVPHPLAQFAWLEILE
ncbi:MAG: hypothetical protein AMS25_10570 [Gemmatimonas sp. SM23_52]|nr:MAG: hypothetical protein AMS25_10570 [Gemmatimonas sp. SM23_52]